MASREFVIGPEVLEDARWRPTRVEWLVNAISEIMVELDELEQQKLKYEYELDQLVKEEYKEVTHENRHQQPTP